MSDVKQKYEVGDAAWIHVRGTEGELSKGRVVHKFSLPDWATAEHYVIEVPTGIDPLLEVREPLEMSHTAEGPIGLWRLARARAANGPYGRSDG